MKHKAKTHDLEDIITNDPIVTAADIAYKTLRSNVDAFSMQALYPELAENLRLTFVAGFTCGVEFERAHREARMDSEK